jgi:ubiquinone/menaquinone biosynthesis C-methylase UbiE
MLRRIPVKRRILLSVASFLAVGLLAKLLPGERRQNIAAIEGADVADAYEQVTNMPQFAVIHWLVARRALAGGFSGQAIDVGGGPGKLALRMARMAPRGVFVSLDSSPQMVALADEPAREAGSAVRVVGVVGSSERIPFPDAHFDLVVSTLSLHHWDEPTLAFCEIDRALKPGGRLLIVDMRRDVALLPWLFVNFIQRIIPFEALRRAGEPIGSFKSAYTPDEARALLAVAGLSRWRVTSGPAWLTIEK